MIITLSLPTTIYLMVIFILIILTIYPREERGGYIDFSGCANLFWLLVAIVFTLIYGGFYFW